MPESHAPENPPRILAAPPGLQLLGGDSAGLCVDGHCVFPAVRSGDDATEAAAGDHDPGAVTPADQPDAGASGGHPA